MKKLYSLIAILFLGAGAAFAQIPNPGMETWANSSPTGWVGYNDVPTGFYTCVQSTDVHAGSLAAKLQVAGANFIGGKMNSVFFTQNFFPLSLVGYYKPNLDPSYQFRVRVYFYGNSGQVYGDTLILPGSTATAYQQFTLQFDTSLAGSFIPDSAQIFCSLNKPDGSFSMLSLGGSVLVDDLSFTPIPTGIQTPAEDNTPFLAVYPNPVKDILTVESMGYLNKGGEIRITSVTGQTVLENQSINVSRGKSKVDINVSDLPPGSYFVTIASGGSSITKPFRKFE